MKKIFFEAKGIQDWISSSGTLLDLSGGSELLEQLISADNGGFLGRALDAAGIKPERIEMNAAGGFTLAPETEAETDAILSLWPLVMRSIAPGLSYRFGTFHQSPHEATVLSFQGEVEQTHRLDGPLVHQSARTGLPAEGQDDKEPHDLLDEGSLLRRKAARGGKSLLFAKLLDDAQNSLAEEKRAFRTLRDADSVTSEDGRRNLAYVHADASGLGAVFTGVREKLKGNNADETLATKILKAFSDNLDEATQAAVRLALYECADAYRAETWNTQSPDGEQMPVRPVLIGGDDMTFVLPSRYGHAFAGRYMRAFVDASTGFREAVIKTVSAGEKDSGQVARIKEVCAHIPERIEIGCGVAYVHMHYPAAAAITLAEDLCDWAKRSVKRTTSAMMFHRVTGSAIRNFEDVVRHDLLREDQLATAGPYLLDSAPKAYPSDKGIGEGDTERLIRFQGYLSLMTTIKDLDALTEALAEKSIPSGPNNTIVGLTRKPVEDAEDRFKQLQRLANDPGREAFREALLRLEDRLVPFNKSNKSDARIWSERRMSVAPDGVLDLETQEEMFSTPVADAQALLSVARAPGADKSKFVGAFL